MLARVLPPAPATGRVSWLRAMPSPTIFASAEAAPPREPPAEPAEDAQVELAAQLAVDGGMPGGTEDERLLATLAALLDFLESGNSVRRGPFRHHVARLMRYLDTALPNVADPKQRAVIKRALEAARTGTPLGWKQTPRPNWDDLSRLC
jgi:hypothetical protein